MTAATDPQSSPIRRSQRTVIIVETKTTEEKSRDDYQEDHPNHYHLYPLRTNPRGSRRRRLPFFRGKPHYRSSQREARIPRHYGHFHDRRGKRILGLLGRRPSEQRERWPGPKGRASVSERGQPPPPWGVRGVKNNKHWLQKRRGISCKVHWLQYFRVQTENQKVWDK